MNWYYVDGGQQAGPVDVAQLAALASTGKIQSDTLVWREGMAGWVPYGEAVPGGAPVPEIGVPPNPGTVAAGGLICCECGRAFGPDEVIRHGEKWVCAACKPIFLQRLREGVALAGAAPRGAATEADLLARDYEVDVGGCLAQGWELFKTNAGIMIGASVLGYGSIFAASIVTTLVLTALHVQFLNFVVILFSAPMMAGLWMFYIKKVRGQDAGVGDLLAGFSSRYVQVFLVALIPGLLGFGVSALASLVTGGMMGASVLRGRGSGVGSALTPGVLIPLAILLMVAGVALIYLSICWRFALPLVADKGLKFWPALQLSRRVVNKHWWMTLVLIFACSFLGGLGILACGVGVLVTGPTAFAAVTFHYDKVFGDLVAEGQTL
jgi:hypothetical protein